MGEQVPGPASELSSSRPMGGLTKFFCWCFGVVLPMLCVLVAMDGESRFLGFGWHPLSQTANGFLIVGSALVTAALLLWRFERLTHLSTTGLALASGATIATTLLYGIVFLPLLPLGILGLIILVGVLVLTPPLSFIAAILCIRRLRLFHVGGSWAVGAFALGFLAASGLLLLPEWNEGAARKTLNAIPKADDEDERTALIADARRLDNHEIYGAFFEPEGRGTWFNGGIFDTESRISRSFNGAFGRQSLSEESLYRITGEIPSAAIESEFRRRDRSGSSFLGTNGWNWPSQFPDRLVLQSSSLDGVIDLVGASAYIEWSFVTRNPSWADAEGWFDLVLPPGSTVSRATLRVGETDREAAFALDAQAREAYVKVSGVDGDRELTEQRIFAGNRLRDPLLIQQVAADRVRLRYAPIPSDGSMRFKVGISIPLELIDASKVRLSLPTFFEGNVAVDPQLEHTLWFEAGSEVVASSEALQLTSVPGATPGFRSAITDDEGRGLAHAQVVFDRPDGLRCRVAPRRKKESDTRVLVQTLVEDKVKARRPAILAIDVSKSMLTDPFEIAAIIEGAPDGLIAGVVLGDDAPTLISPKAAVAKLRRLDRRGGYSGESCLLAALEAVAEEGIDDLIWIHGDQPLALLEEGSVSQWARHAKALPTIQAIAAGKARNRVSDLLAEHADFLVFAGGSQGARVLKERLATLEVGASEWRRDFERLEATQTEELPIAREDLHRIWALDQINKMSTKDAVKAGRLGVDYSIVSAYTSAVCLESSRQYEEFNLVESSDDELPSLEVPTIPEPEEWVLIGLGALLLIYFLRSKTAA